MHKHIPIKITPLDGTRKRVTYRNLSDNSEFDKTFDTILFAIGRTANTQNLNLEACNVKINPENHKILTNSED